MCDKRQVRHGKVLSFFEVLEVNLSIAVALKMHMAENDKMKKVDNNSYLIANVSISKQQATFTSIG